jgi:two-component system phosphate regulon sensor histidine kinase PhoR
MTGNTRAIAIGLSLEKIAGRLRESERAAQAGTLSLQTILGALPDALAVVDERRRVQLMNAKFRKVFALTDAQPAGTPLLEIARDVAIDRAISAALSEGQPGAEAFTRTVKGTRLQFDVSVVPLQENPSRTAGAVVLFRDVTHVQQVEEMRRDFVANVSHELRTPLSIFRGYLETLLDDPGQPPEELVRILEIMERHSNRLTTLVDDVLSLARLESPEARLELMEIDLREYLAGTLRDWEKRFAAKQLNAKLEVSADLPPLHADENRLQELIYNLLDNAVKYSSDGGTVTVSGAIDREAIRLSVGDTGRGIPEQDLPRIFERFYRADKARSRAVGGTGLGLSIVEHIAHLHGGSVEAASQVGSGTTITVTLPLRPRDHVTES